MNEVPRGSHFGELRSPHDLVLKLEHDLSRMASASSDQYAAFDFFVTADSLVDWRWPEQPSDPALVASHRHTRTETRKLQPLARIAAHIANGAKHFVVTRHNSILGVEKERVYEEGVYEPGVFHEPLLVRLTPEEAHTLGCGPTVEAEWLAVKVLAFWRSKLNDT
jgi:hypothetical protein